MQAPVRRQIKARPAGAQPCGVTSATARRILQSLERMSSPLAVSSQTLQDWTVKVWVKSIAI